MLIPQAQLEEALKAAASLPIVGPAFRVSGGRPFLGRTVFHLATEVHMSHVPTFKKKRKAVGLNGQDVSPRVNLSRSENSSRCSE